MTEILWVQSFFFKENETEIKFRMMWMQTRLFNELGALFSKFVIVIRNNVNVKPVMPYFHAIIQM